VLLPNQQRTPAIDCSTGAALEAVAPAVVLVTFGLRGAAFAREIRASRPAPEAVICATLRELFCA